MTRLLLSCAVALAACSAEPTRNETVPTPAVTAAALPRLVAASASAPSDAGVVASPGKLKVFGDWTVGCDNTKRCELRSLSPDDAAEQDVTVSIAREAGPAGTLEVTIDGQEDEDLTPAVDGKAAGTPAAIVAAMANGRVLAALAKGRAVATISLKGASAALRYVDAVQGRAGTVTALVAKGLKPANAVPAAAKPPVIASPTPAGEPAKPTAAQIAAMRKAADCDADALARGTLSDPPEAHALGGGRTLVLLPCSAGAYNLLSGVFVVEGGGFAPVKADAPVGFAETGADAPRVPEVVNGEWRDGVLASYAKGRGLGDCGVNQELVWDGTRLRLLRQREMGACRGNADYITTWRANVVRR